eukprot:XP_022234940.1 LOW QUALITY PROTEIN: predicted protein [Chlamydomonas reinhardtii]
MWQPANVETCLHVLSLWRLGSALLGPALEGQQREFGTLHHICCLVLLAILASLLDRANPDWFKGHPRYTFRACSQAGLAQGLLALPSLSTAIAVATRSWWWHQAARLLVLSSFQVLLWYSATAAFPRSSQVPPTAAHSKHDSNNAGNTSANSNSSSGASGARSGGMRPLFGTRHRGAGPLLTWLYLSAVAGGVLAAAASAARHGAAAPPPSSPRLLLPGSVFAAPRDITASAWVLGLALLAATAPALDQLARRLPRSFTPGEAGVLLQSLLALAAGAAAYLAAAARQGAAHVLWSQHVTQVTQPDPGMHVPAFTMLVLFWVLAMAGCTAAAAMGGAAAPAAPPARGEGDSGKAPDAEPAVAAVAAGAGAIGSSSGGKGRGGSSTSTGAGAPPPSPPSERGLLLRLAAGGGAALSFLMLLDLGLWVLGRFVAASSRPRLATLAYWFGCLAVTVPLMYAVSKASAAREQQARRDREEGATEEGAKEEGAKEEGAKAEGPGQREAGRQEAAGKGIANGGSGHGVSASSNNSKRAAHSVGSSAGSALFSSSSSSGWLLRALAVPHIVMRKGYHLVAILLFLPAFGWDVRMLQASLAVAGVVLVFVELLRCCGPRRLREAIGGFMADFADARDSGPVYVTHFTLLLGIAVPVWLSESVCGAAAGAMMAGLYGPEAAAPMTEVGAAAAGVAGAGAAGAGAGVLLSAAAARMLPSCRTLLGLSGLVSLGSGDTAAACVGFLLGRRRLFRGGKKTWEGTASGAAAMLASWRVVVWWMDVGWALGWSAWVRLAGVTAGVALLEAVTGQLDNVVVPLYYLTHLVLLGTGN